MSESPLSAHAGPIAVIAGSLFVIVHVGQFFVIDPRDLVAMMTDPAFQLFSGAYAMTFPLLLIALVALYMREASEAGLFGAVASGRRGCGGLADPARPNRRAPRAGCCGKSGLTQDGSWRCRERTHQRAPDESGTGTEEGVSQG